MSVSAIFGATLAVAATPLSGGKPKPRLTIGFGGSGVAVIECSSRPQKKSTAHHKKTRPRKTQAWDIKRGPAVYAPLPPLPSEWTLVSPAAQAEAEAEAEGSTPSIEVVVE